jgi:hypothetical protein
MTTTEILINLINSATPHAIVKMLYNCELSNDYSESNQITYLQNYNL